LAHAEGEITMGFILYFLVIAASMMALSRLLPGFRVDGWVPALLASLVLGAANAVLKPILFVLTLPFTILTLGLFLLVLNALMLWITALIVPGFSLHGIWPTFLASMLLSVIGMIWKAATKKRKNDD
jgi:putative membrane protein